MTRSERPESAAIHLENARLSQEVADLKRRIAELEHGSGVSAAQNAHDLTIRQIIDLVPHFLFAKDIDGRFLLVNQAMASAYGRTVPEMTGRTDEELNVDPALAARYRADDLEVIKSEKIKHIAKEPFIDAQGRNSWYQAIKIPYRTADGGKPAILGISQDITGQKQVQEALRESEQKLSHHITHTPIAAIVWDLNFAVREWNPAAEIMFGYSAAEAIGQNALDLIVPDKDRRHVTDLTQRQLMHTRGMRNTNENVTKDGRILRVEWYNTPLKDTAGETFGVAAFALDVTERERAVEALKISESKYRGLFETSLDGILLTDIEGIIQEANPAFLDMLGYGMDDIRGRSVDDLSPPEWQKRSQDIRKKILAGPYGEYEKKYLHRDGSEIPVAVHAWPVGGGENHPERFMGIIRNITERKAAENAIRQSQEMLRNVTDNSPVTISYIDEGGIYRFVNKAYENWYGKPRSDIIGHSVAELIGEDFFKQREPYLRRALAGERVRVDLEREYPVLGKRISEISYVPDFAADGHVRGLFGMGQDVTERRQAEISLRDSEARLAEAQRIANIGSWERHIESGNAQWSDQLFCIYGHEPGSFEPTYDDFLKQVHPNDLDRVKSANEKLAKEGQNYDIIFRIVRTDSVERTISSHVRMFRNQAHKPIRIAGTIRDITEQLEAEDALRRSEQNLRGIMENVPDGVITIDEQGIIQSFNRSAENMFGYAAEEMIGQTVETLMGAEDRSHHQGYIDKYIETGIGAIIGRGAREVQGRQKDGTTFPLELTVSIMHVSEQRIFIGTTRDITERRLVEDQLRQAQKMEAVGQLTGGVAHDFNNLLAVMLGNLELLRDYVSAEGKGGQMIDRAVRAAERGATLTNRLLSFSRNQLLQPEPVDLNNLIAETTDMLRLTLGATIALETVFGENLWPCEVDVSQLENAILNLAINARDAMPGGGTLTIKTANMAIVESDATAQLDAPPGDFAVLSVSDTGSGISHDVLDRVFDPFFSTKDVGQGTGLGLSMVYGFAKQSGGHATIESDKGAGTTVRIFLPRSSEHSTAKDTPASEKEEARGTGEKILVVEDNADVRALALALLAGLGYETFEAADGNTALSVLQQSPPVDLLLSDIVLPGGMNGRELADKVRHLNPAIKILYMSGYADSAFTEPTRQKGDAFLLSKPFGKEDLAEAVRNSLDEEATRT
ncbi:MAG: PAS domain S-box protein [Rhodospirillaceae bacterium]|nr:PAS domain S-box protein [Rhodospirillaceae bacterium]